MKTKDAVRLYGTQQKLATALGITQSAVAHWGGIVPPLQQLRLEKLTRGALKASEDILDVPTRDPA